MRLAVIPGSVQRVRAKRGPMTGSDANLESRADNFEIPRCAIAHLRSAGFARILE